jgi:hypothetical protein
MIIGCMNLSLIISCLIIIAALIVFPLIVSFKAEKKKKLDEWDKIKDYGNKINERARKKK